MRNISSIIEQAETASKALFEKIEQTTLFNQQKIINAFRNNRVSYRHFAPTTGYGYDDTGRDTLAKVFAEVMGAEKAIVSPNIVSGTHALTIALFGLLKMGDSLLCISGDPYDTLQEVIGGSGNGSLKDYGIGYRCIPLKNNRIDFNAVKNALEFRPTVVFITRSRGYSWREAFSIAEIKDITAFVKRYSPDSVIFIDNCYGELTDTLEPCQAGADVIAGSLIKNPGGGLAPTGGYIAGKAGLIDKIANRLTSPSIGSEVGSYNSSYLPFYQGLFLAPSAVEAALKTSVLAANVFSILNYEVSPSPDSKPNDIIRAVKFNTENELVSFIQGVQYSSPVDSHVTPYPWDMPGYQHQVIMAAGTFIQGASIELSADSPIKEPYIAYMQGALTYAHGKIAITECATRLINGK